MVETAAPGGPMAGDRTAVWASPIAPEDVASRAGAPAWPAVAGPETWWCEPDRATATVRLRRCAEPGTPPVDVLGPGWAVGNRAIGYGGRPFTVLAGPERHYLVFTHSVDQRLYLAEVPALSGSGAGPVPVPVPLTPADADGVLTVYADPVASPVPGPDGDEVWCVRETVRTAAGEETADPAPRTSRDIVAVPLSGAAADDPAAVRVVARSHHFLSGVRPSPDGSRLAWIGWDHPDMPWDSSDLMVARIEDGVAVEPVRVLGGGSVSVPQAEWAGPDTLYAMADPDGWWNLHRIDLTGDGVKAACVLRTDVECSHAIWRVGATSFAVTGAGVLVRLSRGDQSLALWDPMSGSLTELAHGWTDFAIGMSGDADAVAVVAASPTQDPVPLRIDIGGIEDGPTSDGPTSGGHTSGGQVTVARCTPATEGPFERWQSVPRRSSATSVDNWEVPYVYYPPTNPDRQVGGTPPPLLIDVHGGPTSRTGGTRSLEFSLFTSRGYAVASVDYGGSIGYGRAYRDRLRHQWGDVDVADCVAVADALARAGLADPRRTAIRGGSAGGWTAIAALGRRDIFACGAVYYPISDPVTWSHGQTHDFESRYIESLVGEFPADRARYREVSPLGNASGITVPFVMFQGLADTICRPDQARRVVEAVEATHGPGLCRAHLEFPGEGHGFRRAATITAALRAELDLYAEVLHRS